MYFESSSKYLEDQYGTATRNMKLGMELNQYRTFYLLTYSELTLNADVIFFSKEETLSGKH